MRPKRQPDESTTARSSTTSENPAEAPPTSVPISTPNLQFIGIGQINVSLKNPRSVPAGLFASDEESEFEAGLRELANSIMSVGLLQPLTVRPDHLKGGFELIAGERRYQAIKQFIPEMTEVPAMVEDVDDATAIAKALVENLMRENLHPLDEARGYRFLADNGKQVKDIAGLVGKNQSHVSNMMRLLKLPDVVQALIKDGSLSKSHGVSLASIADYPEECVRVARQAAANNWPQSTLEGVLQGVRSKKEQERLAAEREVAPPLIEAEAKPETEPEPEAAGAVEEDPKPETDDTSSEEEPAKTQAPPVELATAKIPAPKTVEPPTETPKPAAAATPAKAPAPPATTTTPPPPAAQGGDSAPVPEMISMVVKQADYDWMMENRLKVKDLVALVRSVGSGNLRQFLDAAETLGVEAPVLFEEFVAELLGKAETKEETTTEGAE